MPANPSDGALIDFYEQTDESIRLAAGAGLVELLRIQSLLRDRIGSNERILDVGGADGVHASWLIRDGHDVEIVDLVPLHVDRARQRGLRAHVGDARSLPFGDASFDVVLLLGPLYHLPSAGDRAECLGEARRVLRPGGLVAAAGNGESLARRVLRTCASASRPRVRSCAGSRDRERRHVGAFIRGSSSGAVRRSRART